MPLDDDITTGLSFIFEFTNSLISVAEYRLLIGVPFIILFTGNCLYPVPAIDCRSFFYKLLLYSKKYAWLNLLSLCFEIFAVVGLLRCSD